MKFKRKSHPEKNSVFKKVNLFFIVIVRKTLKFTFKIFGRMTKMSPFKSKLLSVYFQNIFIKVNKTKMCAINLIKFSKFFI